MHHSAMASVLRRRNTGPVATRRGLFFRVRRFTPSGPLCGVTTITRLLLRRVRGALSASYRTTCKATDFGPAAPQLGGARSFEPIAGLAGQFTGGGLPNTAGER